MIADCTAVILTGGDSRRMGQDKAALLLGERTLLQHILTVVQPLFGEVIISVRQPRVEIALRQVCDHPNYQGPLAGLAAGLAHSTTAWNFVVACDMPFINRAVIERLAQFRNGYQAVVPRVNGHLQPLAAFYSTACLDEVMACLDGRGKHSLYALLEKLSVCYVDEEALQAADPQLRSFFDLDTPEDVAEIVMQDLINDLTQ